MLRLLQSIFGQSSNASSELDDDLIERAIERVIDGTDPRLRLVTGYRKVLHDSVVCALEHTFALIEALPEPIELSQEKFSSNEFVRALFVSKDHLNDVLLQSRILRRYLDTHTGLDPENIHALLGCNRTEKNILGMKLEGEMIRRDVAQVSINFSNHQILAPMDSEHESRIEQMRRVFDFFIEIALRGIVNTRSVQDKNRRQHELFASKLRTLEKADWSIEPLRNREEVEDMDVQELERQVAELEEKLHTTDSAPVTLDHYLEVISNSLLGAPEQLRTEVITLNMNRMGIKAESNDKTSVINLQLHEFSSFDGHTMIALPVYIPLASIPTRPDFLTEASRYL